VGKTHSLFYVKTKRRKTLKKQNIAKTVEELLRPTVEGLGYILWDVEYEKIGSEMNLTVTIDKEDGIWISDCETVHRAIDPILDEADPIEDAYRLNVSSKGLEPELRTEEHIRASIGEIVEVRLFAAKDKKKVYIGTLDDYTPPQISIILENDEKITFEKNEISKISIRYIEQ
jgi:ribosome maturation factor RimP